MLPSRLLFAADDVTMAKRVTTFFAGEKSRRPEDRIRQTATRTRNVATGSTPAKTARKPNHLDAGHGIQGLPRLPLPILSPARAETGGPRGLGEELDGARFGSLAHEVLSLLHNDPDVAVAKAETIAKFLDSQLDAAVLAHSERSPLPSIRVQVEQLRRRLAAFAQWQEDWAGQGWRIEHTEVSCKAGKAFLDIGGNPMQLRGRVDRIDVNDTSGRRMIFDYKTSDRATSPEKAHRKKERRVDRPAVAALPAPRFQLGNHRASMDMAYVVLPQGHSQRRAPAGRVDAGGFRFRRQRRGGGHRPRAG